MENKNGDGEPMNEGRNERYNERENERENKRKNLEMKAFIEAGGNNIMRASKKFHKLIIFIDYGSM